MEADQIYRELLELSDLVADAIIKKVQPVRDDVSTKEAFRIYGRAWLEDMRRRGKANPHRIGSRLIYSRHELDVLRASERRYAEIITQNK